MHYFNNRRHVSGRDAGSNIDVNHVTKLSREEFRENPRSFHCHEDYLELVLCVSGTSLVIIDGKAYMASKGDIIIYNCKSYHQECVDQSHQFSLYCIGITGIHVPGLDDNCITRSDAAQVIHTGDSYPLFKTLFTRIFDIVRISNQMDASLLRHYTQSLVLEVLALCEPNEDFAFHPDRSKDLLASQIFDYLSGNFTEKITLQSVGDALSLSPDYVSHLFKDYYGYSPMQYVNALRVGRAQLLLLETDKKISDIAMDVGFNNIGNFNRAFLLFSGDSPREFRKRHTFD
ncbi:MAG: helix-turn-helix transcriptional regulator [Firmicutes bacterium]|nr:helix-turn-helix transcriptional regulator [Bacillota bacterium]